MRGQVIAYLIASRLDVTEENIIKYGEVLSSFSDMEINENTYIDRDLFNNIYKNIVSNGLNISERRDINADRVDKLDTNSRSRIDSIYRRLNDALDNIKSAQVLDESFTSLSNTIPFDIENMVSQETTATISGNAIIGIPKSNLDTTKSKNRLPSYIVSDLNTSLRDSSNTVDARIEVSTNGISHIPSSNQEIINSDTSFSIVGESSTSGLKYLEVLLDKNDVAKYNQLEISTGKGEIVDVYTSPDNILYNQVAQEKYIKDTIIPIDNTSDRYIKIIFHKYKHTRIKDGKYAYVVNVDSLNISNSTIEKTTEMVSKPIEVGGIFSKLSIMACDNSSENVDITYLVSINGDDWKQIKPSNSKSMTFSKAVVDNNSYTDNKFIHIENPEAQSGLPEGFVNSNKIRVFGNLMDGSTDFSFDGLYYNLTAILTEDKEIDFGPNEIIINNRSVSGIHNLAKGIYDISIHRDNYLNQINFANAEITKSENGEYTIKDSRGHIRTVIDPLYPYNHRLVVLQNFDYIVGEELFEKRHYTIYNSDGRYFIDLNENYNDLLVVYRNYLSNINTIKVKAELQSLDNITIPTITDMVIKTI